VAQLQASWLPIAPIDHHPHALDGLAECVLAQRLCQFTLPQSAADPPELKTAKGKGDQTQLNTLGNVLGYD
jgi:hypothetical protein